MRKGDESKIFFCLEDLIYGWVYKTWRLLPLADGNRVATMTANQGDPGLYPMNSQFSISVLLNLCLEWVGA